MQPMVTNSGVLKKNWSSLTAEQLAQFDRLPALYAEWNAKINVISRKDIDQIMERHVLHSLAIAKYITFADGSRVVDIGTGGGFPGIPLAIMFPNVEFTLVDSIGKKIRVVSEVASALGLNNVRPMNMRSEQLHEQFDYVVSRAVTAMPDFVKMTKHLLKHSGLYLCLKGGDLDNELRSFTGRCTVHDLSEAFPDIEFFATKKLVVL